MYGYPPLFVMIFYFKFVHSGPFTANFHISQTDIKAFIVSFVKSYMGYEGIMNRSAFDIYTGKYDTWYDKNPAVYASELEAIRELMP
jgi:hypothetical protein